MKNVFGRPKQDEVDEKYVKIGFRKNAYDDIKKVADVKGLKVTSLTKMWILERLEQEKNR